MKSAKYDCNDKEIIIQFNDSLVGDDAHLLGNISFSKKDKLSINSKLELENVDFDSSKMSIEVFIKGDINNIETDFTVIGGNYINVIPEQDTAEGFGYEENPIRPFFDVFDSPASSNRAGCYDGYCVATVPIVEEEYCYDK